MVYGESPQVVPIMFFKGGPGAAKDRRSGEEIRSFFAPLLTRKAKSGMSVYQYKRNKYDYLEYLAYK